MTYVYVPNDWLDHLIEVDEFGKVVYQKDDAGNFIYWKDEFGNLILDPITNKPIPKPVILQEGTKFTAGKVNNIEQALLKAHLRLDEQDIKNRKHEVESVINGRSPNNNGSFFDTFVDEPTRMLRQTASADITQAVAIGATVLKVDNTEGFATLTEVTIYDGTNSENTLITAIGVNSITVQVLTKAYVKGAKIARSNSIIENGQMKIGDWGTYSVAISEVI